MVEKESVLHWQSQMQSQISPVSAPFFLALSKFIYVGIPSFICVYLHAKACICTFPIFLGF